MQVKCSKCRKPIALSDIFESSNGRLSHMECARPRCLTADERHLLFVHCQDHVVAQCLSCGLGFRMMELATDPLSGSTNMCPQCRKDLTENVRGHLYGCATLQSQVRLRARAVREATQHLVNQSQELVHNVAALFESQEALRTAMRKRTRS